jgi:hypothetical protein
LKIGEIDSRIQFQQKKGNEKNDVPPGIERGIEIVKEMKIRNG